MKVTAYFLLILFIFLVPLTGNSKNLNVVSIEDISKSDLTANTEKVKDLNGNVCSLIKIQLPVEGCAFEGNVVRTSFKTSEYWVYVSPGTKSLLVKSPGFDATEAKWIDGTQSGHTYKLRVTGYEDDIPSVSGLINGHKYVDLGLPSGIKWATTNVGANRPEEYGIYVAWAELKPKIEYTEENNLTKDLQLPDISGNASYDAAANLWGSSWRTPTQKECDELLKMCKWKNYSIGDTDGYKVIGPNGNWIFLPAAGYKYNDKINEVGRNGRYWTSTPDGDRWTNGLDVNDREAGWRYRHVGQPIRAVSK